MQVGNVVKREGNHDGQEMGSILVSCEKESQLLSILICARLTYMERSNVRIPVR